MIIRIQSIALLALPFWTFAHNIKYQEEENELKCTGDDKVYYNGTEKCYQVLTPGPCLPGEWFVLRTPRPTDTTEIVQGECVLEQCPRGRFYWPDVGCVTPRDKERLCGDDDTVELGNDFFGLASCNCKGSPAHGRLYGDQRNPCFQLYQRGPCNPRLILGIPEGDTVPACIEDPCHKEREQMAKSGQLSKSQSLAMFDGTCYILGTQGPCAPHKIFEVSLQARRLACISGGSISYPSFRTSIIYLFITFSLYFI